MEQVSRTNLSYANRQNGGLVLKASGTLFLSDLQEYQGTHMLSSSSSTMLDGVFWFMSHEHPYVYYSDQKREHALCRLDLLQARTEVINKVPCYSPILHKGWIYYINENDRKLYRCTMQGEQESLVLDEQVESFLFLNEEIYYTTGQGIKKSDEAGTGRQKLSETKALNLIAWGAYLVFSDLEKQHTLTLLNTMDGSVVALEEIQATSINATERYIYCTNRINNHSIYRMDPITKSSIRICGESGDYLHILEDQLYYLHHGEWRRISLTGGEAQNVLA